MTMSLLKCWVQLFYIANPKARSKLDSDYTICMILLVVSLGCISIPSYLYLVEFGWDKPSELFPKKMSNLLSDCHPATDGWEEHSSAERTRWLSDMSANWNLSSTTTTNLATLQQVQCNGQETATVHVFCPCLNSQWRNLCTISFTFYLQLKTICIYWSFWPSYWRRHL